MQEKTKELIKEPRRIETWESDKCLTVQTTFCESKNEPQ